MPAEISVIIPTLNAQRDLPECLSALVEGLAAGLIRELIVSDGGSADATAEIAEAVGATVLTGPASRGGQLRRACAIAHGDWIMVLHADTRLDPGWALAVSDHVRSGRTDSGYFQLAFRTTGIAPAIVAGWANLRARLFRLPYGDQGLLIHGQTYARSGGYPDQPLMEDVALARALQGPLLALPVRAVTSAERYVSQGWLRRGGRNLWTLARYLCGADPKALARSYRR